jgi:hypothetical protein
MRFDDIIRNFGDMAWFDFEMVHLVSGEAAACVHTELYRWRQAGKLIELRRGFFTLAEPWRRRPLDGPELAGGLYEPSYLTGAWALARLGALPEAAARTPGGLPRYTSATARPAKVFENAVGRYEYATLPRDLLFGAAREAATGAAKGAPAGAGAACVATPEKALLDWWLIEGGDWDEGRMEAAALDPAPFDIDRLGAAEDRAGRPRLAKAVRAFRRYAARKGAVQC